jgi:hypothetical protein
VWAPSQRHDLEHGPRLHRQPLDARRESRVERQGGTRARLTGAREVHELGEQQRMAAALLGDRARPGGIPIGSEQRARQRCCRGRRKPRDGHHLGARPAAQRVQAGARLAVDLVARTHGRQDEDGRRRFVLDQRAQQAERFAVGPLEVVHHQDHGPLAGKVAQQRGERMEARETPSGGIRGDSFERAATAPAPPRRKGTSSLLPTPLSPSMRSMRSAPERVRASAPTEIMPPRAGHVTVGVHPESPTGGSETNAPRG